MQPMAEAEARYVQGDLLVRNGFTDAAAEELVTGPGSIRRTLARESTRL